MGKAAIESLPFIGIRQKGEPGKFPRHFWRVSPTGDYEADCQIGREMAMSYLAWLTTSRGSGSGILGHIVGDMPRQLTGIEIAFLQMIDFAAGAGEHEARRIDEYWKRCEQARAA